MMNNKNNNSGCLLFNDNNRPLLLSKNKGCLLPNNTENLSNNNASNLTSFTRNMATQQPTIASCVEQEQELELEQEQEETIYCHGSAKVLDKCINEDFELLIDNDDTLFTLALNYSEYYSEKVGNIITKMVVIKESYYINIDELNKVLAVMNTYQLYIFS